MIPTIELAQESFQEIFEKSRKRISTLYPKWTNFNTNDTGIALLELLSWLKEVQDFHLDQIGDTHLEMYLKLMGMRPTPARPAHTIVHCSQVEREEVLPKGQVFLAREITFQSEEAVRLYTGQLLKLSVTDEKGEPLCEWKEMGQRMHFPIFGEKPSIGNCMEMLFDRPFTKGEIFGFYFSIFENYEIKRNPISEMFLPLTKIRIEYKTLNDWKNCKIVKDETFGLLKSGILQIQIPFFEEDEQQTDCCLRIRMDEGEYDAAPFLNYLHLNPIPLIQCKTVAEFGINLDGKTNFIYQKEKYGYKEIQKEDRSKQDILGCRIAEGFGNGILGQGTGFPNQSIPVGFSGVLEKSVEILVENPEYPKYFEVWKRVEDFGSSTPEDKHFIVNERENTICFGDNRKGMAPEGEIRLLSAMQTEGILGNVKKRQIHATPLSDGEAPFFIVTNEENVLDGANQETFAECFERFQKEVRETDYANTKEDFEYHILNTPGLMIEKAKVVEINEERNIIYAAVKPWGEEECPKLTQMYKKNISNYMDTKRLIGTDFRVMEPEYIHITLYIELEMRTHCYNVNQTVKERLKKYFQEFQGEFGQPIRYSALYGFLDSMQDVAKVYALTIDANGQGMERNRNGDIILPPNGLVNLKQVQCSVFYSK